MFTHIYMKPPEDKRHTERDTEVMKGFIIRAAEVRQRLRLTAVMHQHYLHHFSAHAAAAGTLKNHLLCLWVVCRLWANTLACFHLKLLLPLMSGVFWKNYGTLVPESVRSNQPRVFGCNHNTVCSCLFPLLELKAFLFLDLLVVCHKLTSTLWPTAGNFPFGVRNAAQMFSFSLWLNVSLYFQAWMASFI